MSVIMAGALGGGARRAGGGIVLPPTGTTSYNGVVGLPTGVVTASSATGFSRPTGAPWTTWAPWEDFPDRLARYTGGTIDCNTFAEVQAAATSAAPWSRITLPPLTSGTIVGALQIPNNKPLAFYPRTWTTIHAARPRNYRARFGGSEDGAYARWLTPGQGPEGCLTDSLGSTLSKFQDVVCYGIEFGVTAGNTSELGGLVQLTGITETAFNPILEEEIHDGLILDHCRARPETVAGNKVKNGLVVSLGKRVAMVDCCFDGFDAAAPLTPVCALSMIAGPGPFFIRNNRLEAVYSSWFIGGGGIPQEAWHAADIIGQGNDISKRPAWSGRANVINLMEVKAAKRALIEGTRTNHVYVGQQSWAFNFTSINQGDTLAEAYTRTEDITLRGVDGDDLDNFMTLSAVGFGVNAQPMRRVYLEHVLARTRTVNGTAFVIVGSTAKQLSDIDINRMTLVRADGQSANLMFATTTAPEAPIASGGVLRNSILSGPVVPALSSLGPSAGLAPSRNVFANAGTSAPANNLGVADTAALQFVDAAARNYALQAGSPAKGYGEGGIDAGADPVAVAALTSGCASGEWPAGFGY